MKQNYRFITLLWPLLFSLLFDAPNLVAQSEAPASPLSLETLENELKQFERQDLKQTEFEELNGLWHDLAAYEFNEALPASRLREQVTWRARLLIRASKLRSRYLEAFSANLSMREWIRDSWLELQIIPVRWTTIYANRIFTIKAYLREGASGYLKLIPDFLALIFIFFLPFLLRLLIQKVLHVLDRWRLHLIDIRRYRPWREKAALALQRCTPFIPWVLIIIGLDFLSDILQGTLVAELSLLIPYILYYCYYRIFRQLVLNLLRLISEKAMVTASASVREKMNRTSLVIARTYFIILCLLHTVSSVASEGLLYREIVFLSYFIGLAFFYQTVWRWREETDRILERNFKGGKFNFLTTWQEGLLFPIAGPISFLVAILLPFYYWLEDQVSEFEIFKSIAAKIFKRKLESTEGLEGVEEDRLPADYTSFFQLRAGQIEGLDEGDELIISPLRDPLDKLVEEIKEWREGKSEEHTIAIYGIKGAGKSTTLGRLEKHFAAEVRVIRADVPAKLTTRESVFKFCGHLLNGEALTDAATLLDWDAKMPPTLVILDETQNFFLGKIGGFAGIKAFFELLNARTENIFWCASFNRYSWNYLDQVFAKNRYFRAVYEIEGMNEEDLQQLIMKRHNQSHYRLSFAEIIRALRSYSEVEDTSYVENLFFRMLYEESKGNPRAALSLWLRALRIKRKGVIKVGLPLNPKLSILSTLSDESHFVYAGLIRHENLTSRELVEVTSLAEGVVRYALRVGLENEFIDRDEHGRYRLRALMQAPLTQYLRAKNFIYG